MKVFFLSIYEIFQSFQKQSLKRKRLWALMCAWFPQEVLCVLISEAVHIMQWIGTSQT